jgi:hypothetical protein
MVEMRNTHKFLVRIPERKKPFGRWESNIRMYLREVLLEDVAWMRVAQNGDHLRALVNVVMNFLVP